MRRSSVSAAALVVAAVLLPSPASADHDAGQSGSCVKPVPFRHYDADVLVFGVDVDLSGCDWWTGDAMELSATVARLDGVDDEAANLTSYCASAVAVPSRPGSDAASESGAAGPRPPADPESDVADPRFEAAAKSPRTERCSVALEMEHPTVEVARYFGEIEYPWADGTMITGFVAACTSTPAGGHCENLPYVAGI